jgi:hypothetical protein
MKTMNQHKQKRGIKQAKRVKVPLPGFSGAARDY